jgi:putative SOS response-associated peptidase YedK
MCGRFALRTPVASLREVLHFDNTPRLEKRYNIAPAQEVLYHFNLTTADLNGWHALTRFGGGHEIPGKDMLTRFA